MKRILSILLAALLIVSLAACGDSSHSDTKETQPAAEKQEESAEGAAKAPTESPQPTDGEEETPVPSAQSAVLVAFFSATGTTKGVAEKIAAITGGDLYEIVPAEPYTDADLNYNNSSSRSTKEQNDKSARPEIGSEDISLEGYATVYLGFPIWWGEEPRILDTFVEKYSFDGVRVIPFCTSGGSGTGRSGPNMEALAGSGIWLEGKRFGGNVSEADLRAWIDAQP